MTRDGMAVGLRDGRDDDVSDSKNLARSCWKVLAYNLLVSTPNFQKKKKEEELLQRINDSLHEASS